MNSWIFCRTQSRYILTSTVVVTRGRKGYPFTSSGKSGKYNKFYHTVPFYHRIYVLTEGKGNVQMAVGFVVGLLLTVLIARCRSSDLRCCSRLKLPTIPAGTGHLETSKSTILQLTVNNLEKHNELYPPERQSIQEMIISQFDWLRKCRGSALMESKIERTAELARQAAQEVLNRKATKATGIIIVL